MILTLCGSARYEYLYHLYNKELSLRGHVVLSLAAFPSIEGGRDWYTEAQKRQLDIIHLRKIELSDGIVVLNAKSYVGESTQKEIGFARASGKAIYYLVPPELTDLSLSELLAKAPLHDQVCNFY